MIGIAYLNAYFVLCHTDKLIYTKTTSLVHAVIKWWSISTKCLYVLGCLC